MRRNGAVKLAVVGLRVPVVFKARMWAAMPERRSSVMVIRFSRLAYAW